MELLPSRAAADLEDAGKGYLTGFLESLLGFYSVAVSDGESEHGVEFADPAAINEVLDPWNEEEIGRLADAAPDGVTDPDAMLADFEAILDKWTGILTEEGVEPLEDFDQWPENVVNGPDAPYEAAIEQFGQ